MWSIVFCSLLFIRLFTACTREAVSPANNSSNNTAGAVSSNITNGTWVITSHTERGENKTSDYAGVEFSFSQGGGLTVTGAAQTSGSWSVSGNLFNISLGSQEPFRRLTDQWKVVEQSSSILRLDHVEAAQDEHLTFSKKQ